MNDEEKQDNIGVRPEKAAGSNKGLWGAVIILLCATAIGLGYAFYQQNISANLSTANSDAQAKLAETGREVQMLSQKLNALEASEATSVHPASLPGHRTSERRVQARRRPAIDRYRKLEAELAEHQKEIDSTQQALTSTRSEFANNLNAAQTELGGSIAKTHDELVALEKKGERNYVEFGIPKSKRFNREGPVSIKLRKANTKHEYADLELIVNDREVTKKHVNIYEPVMFYPADGEPPVQLVINGIQKNYIRGYVSTPKYSASQLSAANSAVNASGSAGTATGTAAASTGTQSAATPRQGPAPAATPVELEHRPQP